jgi:hypothetical protein
MYTALHNKQNASRPQNIKYKLAIGFQKVTLMVGLIPVVTNKLE